MTGDGKQNMYPKYGKYNDRCLNKPLIYQGMMSYGSI